MVKPPLEKFREKYHPKQFGAERAPMRIQGMINETVFLKMREITLFTSALMPLLIFLSLIIKRTVGFYI